MRLYTWHFEVILQFLHTVKWLDDEVIQNLAFGIGAVRRIAKWVDLLCMAFEAAAFRRKVDISLRDIHIFLLVSSLIHDSMCHLELWNKV